MFGIPSRKVVRLAKAGVEDPANVKLLSLDKFSPLPPQHPLAPGLTGDALAAYVTQQQQAGNKGDLAMEPLIRQSSMDVAGADELAAAAPSVTGAGELDDG